ncbi:MAG: DUF86 domain-containing protein [Candidatus Jordarchaeum sp.]|uniref:DUF86 domain-containing protein n=1 Tax=Candidatus Jordarchaeum sp. TaxID=2823881 RepID=UPI004049A2E7
MLRLCWGDLPPNLSDQYQFEALLHRLHTSIEAIMSILAMLVKDLGFNVGDDYFNIKKLESAGIIKIEMADFLRKLNGLRNAIVHKYNKFDGSIVREELDEVLSGVFDFLEVIENVLQEIVGGD